MVESEMISTKQAQLIEQGRGRAEAQRASWARTAPGLRFRNLLALGASLPWKLGCPYLQPLSTKVSFL